MSIPWRAHYVYFDRATKKHYYYDAITAETTYVRPSPAWLLDPQTRAPFVFPGEPTPVYAISAQSRFIESQSAGAIAPGGTAALVEASRLRFYSQGDRPSEATEPIISARRTSLFKDRSAASVALPRTESFFPNPDALALPNDIKAEIHKFQITEFAHQFFRGRRAGKTFGRQKSKAEDAISFQPDPITKPLLQGLDKMVQKKAIESFRLILSYSGADGSSKQAGNPAIAQKLIGLIAATPELSDEVFGQLIKQTRGNPRRECLLKTWELFMIIVTVFPSTRNSEESIKSHLFRSGLVVDAKLAAIAQFTYIRFCGRCLIGKSLDPIALPLITTIPLDPYESHNFFGVSVYEQLWQQRNTYPRFPVPLILHRLAQAIIEKGGERVEGIFRLSGNLAKVKQMTELFNEGQDPAKDADLHDCASCFKAWFAALPTPFVTGDSLGSLKTAHETRSYLRFLGQLPPAYLMTLKYLTGFLQRLVRAEEVTKMGAANLAIVFAPNIVEMGEILDQGSARLHGETAQGFLVALIHEWDTSDLYPPPDVLLERGSG
jgi:hypothetical protein